MNIGYSINYCSKLLRNRLNIELEKEGITAVQFAVIKAIDMNSKEEGLTSIDIAKTLDMDKPTTSGIVNRLIRGEYLEKWPNKEDKRSFRLKLTQKTIKILPKLEVSNEKVISLALEGLEEKYIKEFEKALNKIILNLQEER